MIYGSDHRDCGFLIAFSGFSSPGVLLLYHAYISTESPRMNNCQFGIMSRKIRIKTVIQKEWTSF